MERLQRLLLEGHPEAAEIVAGHAAVERELRLILKRRLRSSETLRTLSVIDVIERLEAFADDTSRMKVLNAVRAFTSLRDAIIHGDDQAVIDRDVTTLVRAMSPICSKTVTRFANIATLAIALVSALQISFDERYVEDRMIEEPLGGYPTAPLAGGA